MNLSVSLTLNSDHTIQKRIILCNVVEITMHHRGNLANLNCGNITGD